MWSLNQAVILSVGTVIVSTAAVHVGYDVLIIAVNVRILTYRYT